MISKNMSVDIVKYLQKKKEMSIDEIATAMESAPEHIQEIVDKKSSITANDLSSYLKNTETRFWEIAVDAELLKYLPQKTKKNVLLCQEISQHIKNRKK